jgi:hypothetical protein
MKRICFVFAISLLINYLLFCQEGYFLPGETQELRDQIQNEVHSYISANHTLGMILNIDSCIGFGWKIKYPPMGEVSNPYGTLTHCIVFVTDLQGYPTPTDSASGVIGVFKDGNIIWHSNGTITVKYDISSDWIWCVKDINNDGKVEILVNWREGFTQGLMNLWVVSWDGTNGQIINDKDKYGFSTIRTSGSWDFNLADVEGDGIWEIQGAMEPKHSSADTLRKIPDSDYSLYTYSWNGSLYGLWSSTPQPLYGASYPRNKAQVDISASTQQNGNALDYNYKVHNLNTSYQFVEEFGIDRLVDTVKFNSTRNYWKGYRPWLPVIEWWCSGIHGVNYIQSGETEPSFSFTTVTPSLPKILNFYSFGLNEGASDDSNDSLENSFRGLTIGPTNPPTPFVQLTFLDTLSGYTSQSRTLGWIKDSVTAVKYLGYFSTAKIKIQQNDTATAKATLQQVLSDVNVDSTSHITSEAYALLRFNTEYLIPRIVPLDTLRVPSQYATIQAAINAADSGRVILVSAGTYNEQANIVNKKSLKLIALDTLVPLGNVTIQGITISNSSNITVKGFKIYASGTSQDAVQITGAQNTNITIEANDIQNSSRNGIALGQNNDNINIVNNVIANNDQNGINFATGATGTQYIVNNTIVKNGKCGIEAVGPQKLLIVNNIIIYDTLAGRSGERLVRGAGTTYIMQKNNLVLRRQNGVLQNDYRLVPGSIAIDKGTTNFAPLPGKDKDGNSRVSGTTIDVGAYEYQQ